MAKKCCYNKFSMNVFLGGKEDEDKKEDKRMVKLDFIPQNCPFWTYITINQHIHFLVHGRSIIRFTPSEGPRGIVN